MADTIPRQKNLTLCQINTVSPFFLIRKKAVNLTPLKPNQNANTKIMQQRFD